tara:strand:- start:1456 stop:2166 length:711 start_codon:yes stop_codon:yes gene_type:complete
LLKKAIEKNSTVCTYGLFSGTMEISLSLADIKINAFTNKAVIYQFWHCLFENSDRLYNILTDKSFKFRGVAEYNLLQEGLPRYKDVYYRSSLFFMLNRCSDNGQVSCGQFNPDNYNPIALNCLKTFEKPALFNVFYYQDNMKEFDGVDYTLFHSLNFSYNLTDIGVTNSYDNYNFNNRKLKKLLETQKDRKIIMIYNNHPGLFNFYKEHNLTMVDKYGYQTDDKKDCEEIIVTNFD